MLERTLQRFVHDATRLVRSRAKRQRLLRGSLVVMMFAFAAGGVDYVLTGGPDWNPMAAEAARVETIAAAPSIEAQPISLVAEAPARAAPEAGPDIAINLSLYDPTVSADQLLGDRSTVLAGWSVEQQASLQEAAFSTDTAGKAPEAVAPIAEGKDEAGKG